MNRRKLDARLNEAISTRTMFGRERFPVAVRLAREAAGTDLAEVEHIVGRTLRYGQPVVAADITLEDLSLLCDNPAVLAVQLARALEPISAR